MLTGRQRDVLDFIRSEQGQRGLMPSNREIMRHFGFASPNAVTNHLRALERKGVLQRSGNIARGIILQDRPVPKRWLEVPVFGTIPAGMPADQQQESDGCITVDMDTLRLPKGARVFALKVRGDSMINAGILSGDTVILEFKEPRNGDVVAALIDGDTTLKRYLTQRGRPFLKAENPKYPDLIPAQELVIQGVQIALFRVLKP